MQNFKNLYEKHIAKIKPSGSDLNQFVGLCPFHDDENASFSGNYENGLWICHAGCGSGTAYHFAKRLGIDPTPYTENGNDTTTATTLKDIRNVKSGSNSNKITKAQLQALALAFHSHLIEKLKSINVSPSYQEVLKKLGVGYDPDHNRLIFPHFDIHSNIVAIRFHKSKNTQPFSQGDGRCRLYPLHWIEGYDKSVPLVFCEGEKDVITLLSHGWNAVTSTTGVGSLPEDLSPLKDFKRVIIVFDNDKAGRDGAKKLATELRHTFSEMKVYTHHWEKSFPKGYDVTDFFEGGGNKKTFKDQLANAVSFRLPNEPKPFKIIGGMDFFDKDVEKHPPIVEELIPYKSVVIMAGYTGVGKSLLVHQIGLAVALGLHDILGFEITRPIKVLYLNFEMSEERLHERHQTLIGNMNTETWDEHSGGDLNENFHINVLDKDTVVFKSQWGRIEETIKHATPRFDLVIVDNVYASTGEDEERNYKLKPLLSKIAKIRDKYGCSIVLVTHHVKRQVDDKYLDTRMVRGGSTLTNFADVVIQMAQSGREEAVRILKITKNRGKSPNWNVPLGIKFDDEILWFSMLGPINEVLHLLKPDKLDREKAFEAMPDEFETGKFIAHVVEEMKKSRKTAFNWLDKLNEFGQVEKTRHGTYKKVQYDEL